MSQNKLSDVVLYNYNIMVATLETYEQIKVIIRRPNVKSDAEPLSSKMLSKMLYIVYIVNAKQIQTE